MIFFFTKDYVAEYILAGEACPATEPDVSLNPELQLSKGPSGT